MIELDDVRPGVVLLRDSDGLRHAAPLNAIRGVHELDDGGTAIAFPGRVVVIPQDFEETVLRIGWVRTGVR